MRLSLEVQFRRRMPIWIVSKAVRTNRGLFFRPIGRFRAWTEDDAIRAGAEAVRALALLKAEQVRK